jgi:hypothetical protein
MEERKKKDEEIQIFSWCSFSLNKSKLTLTLSCLVMLAQECTNISLGVREKCSWITKLIFLVYYEFKLHRNLDKP